MEIKPWQLEDVETGEKRLVKIGACTSVPRLAFTAHWGQMHTAFANLDIPVIKMTGYSWGACLQRAMNKLIDVGCDWIITIDYDGIFDQQDILQLLTLAARYDEADAIFPWQIKRGGIDKLLVFLRDENDKPLTTAPKTMFQGELIRAFGGHFGLTLFKVDALKRTPKPWLWEQPNADGEWVEGKEDADLRFWRIFKEAGNKVFLANDVRIGHIDEEILWPGADFQTVRQGMYSFYESGRPNLGIAPVPQEPQAVKLNLGAGGKPIDGYENIDHKTGGEAFPLPYADGSVDEVRASHVLEHFGHGKVGAVVKDWARVLKPGGVLRVAVPDFDYIVKAYSNGHRNNPMLEGYLFGGQVDGDDYHKAFFNEEKLTRQLEAAGITDIRRWTSDIQDCAALPVSLNLEGRKNGHKSEQLERVGTSYQDFADSVTLYNYTSQYGEDALIEAIFQRIGTANKWCLECGAADGLYFSNTHKLIKEGWSAVLVEPDEKQYAALSSLYMDNPNVRPVKEFAGLKPGARLDDILERCGAPLDLDLAVIDVDGQDYHLWNSMARYRPRVVMIEFDPKAEPRSIPAPDGEGQAGLHACQYLAAAKGYQPICRTQVNLICVTRELAPLFAKP